MSIQQIVIDTNQTIRRMNGEGTLTKQIVAVGIEINQRYSEYLEALETAEFPPVQTGVTVNVEGKTVHFQDTDDFSNWVAEYLT